MDAECHPVWRDFYYSRIKAGDELDAVTARTRPSVVKREGESVLLEYYQEYQKGYAYFTGIMAEARDGRLVSAYAYSCTWTRQFFDETGQEEVYFGDLRYRRLPQGGAMSVLH